MSTILVLCPYVPHPPTHGGSIRSRVLLEALVQGNTVHLAAPIGTAEERQNAAALAKELGLLVHELPKAPARRGALFRKLACWLRRHSELFARRWARGARARVDAIMQEHAFDLVVADSSFVLPLLPRRSPPLLLHLHNLEHHLLSRSDLVKRPMGERWTRNLEGACMQADERRAIRRAVLTVTVSDRDRFFATTLAAGGNVASVPNSVDLDALPLLPPAPAGPPRLLFVGTFDYPPNLEAVTELIEHHLPALRAAFPGLRVRLVGRDDGGHGVRFRGVQGVEVIGPVHDLLPHYRDSHAVYLPIRSGGGTRIKILEAWALGRPVVATGVATEGLLDEDDVHYRRFQSVEQGVAALRDVLAGQGERLVAAGRALVEQHHSHRAAIARLRELTAAVLAQAARS